MGYKQNPNTPRKINMEPKTTPLEFRKMLIFGDVNGLKNWGFLGVLTLLVGDGAYLHLVVSQAVHLQRRWECYPTTSSEKSRFCCWAKCFFLAKPKPPGFDRFWFFSNLAWSSWRCDRHLNSTSWFNRGNHVPSYMAVQRYLEFGANL